MSLTGNLDVPLPPDIRVQMVDPYRPSVAVVWRRGRIRPDHALDDHFT